ncbi:hypothetical protein OsJ_08296 [Oryza sativa Japonica Group]|uniref:Uncharacterized protein n=1 Tax=Oryza sativa subsp. japonica TaxID=39947 RepID=B9F2V5_ORYSJ|nr:hypothetical protein OsJ_08296 [Oryza sativa Japonica Group]
MGTPAVVDDDLRELIDELMNTGPEDEADDRDFEESMATVLSMVTDYLDDPDPPSPELADWAAAAESGAQKVADGLASRVENLRRGLSVFAGTGRPEEAVLRKHAAWTDARRAKAAGIASAARRLRKKDLRSLAARGGLVNPRMAELIASLCARTSEASDERGFAGEHLCKEAADGLKVGCRCAVPERDNPAAGGERATFVGTVVKLPTTSHDLHPTLTSASLAGGQHERGRHHQQAMPVIDIVSICTYALRNYCLMLPSSNSRTRQCLNLGSPNIHNYSVIRSKTCISQL